MIELKNKIIALCNESGLNIEAILFILKDLFRDAQEAYEHYNTKKEELEDEKSELEKDK